MRVRTLLTMLFVALVAMTAGSIFYFGRESIRSVLENELFRRYESQVDDRAATLKGSFERLGRSTELASRLPPIEGLLRSIPTGVDPLDVSSRAQWLDRLNRLF